VKSFKIKIWRQTLLFSTLDGNTFTQNPALTLEKNARIKQIRRFFVWKNFTENVL